MSWLDALILGIVQGLTEFLPISSDGHLSIAQKFLAWHSGRTQTGEENLFFVVMVHLGTLAAIIVYYRRVWLRAIRGVLGSSDLEPGYDRASVIRTCLLAIVATVPAVFVGLLLKKRIEAAFASLTAAGIGFIITGCVLLVTTRLKGGEKGPAQTTWLDALLIGLAQAFAPLPGVSRSGLTITSGLARGLSREWAVGFSLLMAVPVIAGAGVLELKDVTPAMLAPEFLWPTIFAAIVAGLVGYGAILWLVRLARAGRLWYFSVYLFVLGIGVLILAR
ncbi:MAG TPA: undecaprenyl-diphosphate phosphatase [Isosphaeraceae bacterium]|jgi:undecaprenyl-diphosphatase